MEWNNRMKEDLSALYCNFASHVKNILVIQVWGHMHKRENLVLFMKGLVSTYIPALYL